MENSYSRSLIRMVQSFDINRSVSEEFVNQVMEDKLSLTCAVEDFFSDESFDVECLTQTPECLITTKHQIVGTGRPYIAITQEGWNKLVMSGHKYHSTSNGKVLTYGEVIMHGDERVLAVMPVLLTSIKKAK